jgi:hypothetical protein
VNKQESKIATERADDALAFALAACGLAIEELRGTEFEHYEKELNDIANRMTLIRTDIEEPVSP